MVIPHTGLIQDALVWVITLMRFHFSCLNVIWLHPRFGLNTAVYLPQLPSQKDESACFSFAVYVQASSTYNSFQFPQYEKVEVIDALGVKFDQIGERSGIFIDIEMHSVKLILHKCHLGYVQ